MTIEATIVADSISPDNIRLTSVQLRYPRFIHSELLTHRVFSRNASSSRAIPVKRMIEDLRRDPAMPVHWGANQKGMQANEELPETELYKGFTLRPRDMAKSQWLEAMEEAIAQAEGLIELGLHKQIANRILEPWAHINVLVTSTSWANFFTLRRHPDAQPEIKELADRIYEAMEASDPFILNPGQWHLPYVPHWERADIVKSITGKDWREEWEQDDYLAMAKVSVARCARVSYLTHDGRQTTVEEDLQLYDRLVGSQPLHASPAEHQATPDGKDTRDQMLSDFTKRNTGQGWETAWEHPELHGNFTGWIQLRKTLPGENTTTYEETTNAAV